MSPKVGKYQLLRQLGRGGMAEVFLALETGPASMERLVVLKRVLPEYTQDQQFNTMFLDEARIAMRLNHPNIAHVYEVGEHEGEHFLALEYVHGADLRSVLRRWEQRRLTAAQAALIGARAASALHHAHHQKTLRGEPLNLVHRDVSPANICISHEGMVKVLDFGIAKASTNLDRTLMGVLKGKFPYMSPEQARAEPLDGRSDLFSLGIVLFEALTYRRLFKRDTDAQSIEALLGLEIAPPSVYAEAPIPSELDRITLRLLQRDPDQRYQTALELEQDLEAYLRTDPASAADLAHVMTDLFGDRRDLSALVQEMFATGDGVVQPYTPSQSLPVIAGGDDTATRRYQGHHHDGDDPGEAEATPCLHCGELHGPDHQFCPATGQPIAGRQLSARVTHSQPAFILDEAPEETGVSGLAGAAPGARVEQGTDVSHRPEQDTEEALPDHLFGPPPEEGGLEVLSLAVDPAPPARPDGVLALDPPADPPRRGLVGVPTAVWVVLLALVVGVGVGVGVWRFTSGPGAQQVDLKRSIPAVTTGEP